MKTILFDLDGTLLPMDQARFIESYFSRLAAKLAPRGYEPDPLFLALWSGTAAMVKNNGSRTNEEVFWADFVNCFSEKALDDKPLFDEFYRFDFDAVKESCGYAPESAALIRRLKEKGHRLVLATNPLFPAAATYARIRWAGLDVSDFDLVTTYENSHFCKPNPAYYEEILRKLGLSAKDCVMVGNDTFEDLSAGYLGMPVFLLTDCLINVKKVDLTDIPHGSFAELSAFLESLNLSRYLS